MPSLPPGLTVGAAALGRAVWRSAQVAVVVAVVVVPFGYALTGVHGDVLLGAVAGLAVGAGLSLRMGARDGRSVGILIGCAVGVATALIASFLPDATARIRIEGVELREIPYAAPWGRLVPPILALAMGLVDGLGASRLRGYREAARESLTLSALLGAGLLLTPSGIVAAVASLCLIPQNAIIAGFFNRNHEGRRYSRPPIWLLLPFLAAFALIALISHLERAMSDGGAAVAAAAWSTLGISLPVFLAARALAVWMRPRLRVYSQLADYFRVMWVPIGGFAAGYLAIIVVFAGFFGMLERFRPGSFAGAADAGLEAWIFFSFRSALVAETHAGITPASGAAELLVAAQLILSVGWALVVFAAVMSAIQPQLEEIARQRRESGD